MKYINKIEISKFRSFGQFETIDCSDINIFSGANDSGKSNILKAINLFFNGKADFHPYNSENDFNKWFRDNDVRGKRDISIKIFFNDGAYRDLDKQGRKGINSGFIAEKIFKDSGAIDTNFYYLDNKEIDDDASRIRADATIREKIRYLYIPAIRDSDFRKSIQRQLEYIANSTDKRYKSEDLKQAFTELEKGLKDKLSELSTVINESLKIDIQTEVTFSSLLESLSFNTFGDIETKGRGTKGFTKQPIALQSRGDGIQMHFLSFLLWFVAKEDKKHNYILGFEEPEIAFEFKRQFDMVKKFVDVFSKNIQFFVTTHSPAFAFYDEASKTTLSKFRVYRDIDKTTSKKRNISRIKNLENYYTDLFTQFEQGNLLEKQHLERDLWGINYQRLSNILGDSLKGVVDFRHINQDEFDKLFLELARAKDEILLQNDNASKISAELQKAYPSKIFIYEDENAKQIWVSLFEKAGIDIADIDFRSSKGCTVDNIEIAIMQSQETNKNYQPSIFRQLDLDGYNKDQTKHLEENKSKKYLRLKKYKLQFLPVNELENFAVISDSISFCDDLIDINTITKLQTAFVKTVESNLRAVNKSLKNGDLNKPLYDEGKKFEMFEESKSKWKNLLPGKEICSLIQNYKVDTYFKNLSYDNFPKELTNYLEEIKKHFS
ncbi:MAG: AAA family ATPase [Bacteroidota bacterium]|nr:AAA family ATPase [Bacteroidota bacterium]